jgi:hypothetical protein
MYSAQLMEPISIVPHLQLSFIQHGITKAE